VTELGDRLAEQPSPKVFEAAKLAIRYACGGHDLGILSR